MSYQVISKLPSVAATELETWGCWEWGLDSGREGSQRFLHLEIIFLKEGGLSNALFLELQQRVGSSPSGIEVE